MPKSMGFCTAFWCHQPHPFLHLASGYVSVPYLWVYVLISSEPWCVATCTRNGVEFKPLVTPIAAETLQLLLHSDCFLLCHMYWLTLSLSVSGRTHDLNLKPVHVLQGGFHETLFKSIGHSKKWPSSEKAGKASRIKVLHN